MYTMPLLCMDSPAVVPLSESAVPLCVQTNIHIIVRVLSRNVLLGGKCALGRSLGPSPQENIACLYHSTSIRQCLLAQARAFSMPLLYIAIGKKFGGGSLSVWERSPPPSRLNPDCQCIGLSPTCYSVNSSHLLNVAFFHCCLLHTDNTYI